MHDWKNWTWKIRWQNEWEKNKWLKELKFITIPKAFWHFVKISNNLQVISFFYCCSIILVPLFPPLLSPALPTPHPPTFNPSLQVVFVHGSFIHVPWWPLPYYPVLFLSPSSLVTISLFFISVSVVVVCLFVLFCWLGSAIKWKENQLYGKTYLLMIPWTRAWSPKYIKNSYNSTLGR